MNKIRRRISISLAIATISAIAVPAAFAEDKCVRVVGYEWSAKNTADPAKINNMADSMYSAAIYEPLVWLDSGFKAVPYLAESWEPSPDASVWTFHLRQGVKFHDGSGFDAADVVHTYKRLLDPKTASPAAAELDFLSKAKITAVDAATVRFELAAPDTELPSRLASKFALIVADGATGEQLAAQPNGTGPFELDRFVPEAPRAVLKANADYWQQGKPKASCLELSAITEPVSRAAAMLSGQADVLLVADPTTIDQLRSSGNVDITDAKGSTFIVFTMQTDEPPFDNVKVRQALKAVVDRDAMVELALFGMGTPGNDNPVPPTSLYAYVDKAPAPDIERAKQLLAEAGHGDGLKVELNTGATELYPGMLTMVQAYREMAAAAGIDVQIVTSPSDSYWDEVWLKRPFFTSYWSPRPSGPAFASGYTCAAKYNETHWCRPEFDALLKNASETLDEAKRVKLYKQAQKTLAEEGGVIVPAFSSLTAATRKGCSGYAPHVDVNRMQFADLTCQ